MFPMTKAEITAILTNAIGTLTPKDLLRICSALNMLSGAHLGVSVTPLSQLAALFPDR